MKAIGYVLKLGSAYYFNHLLSEGQPLNCCRIFKDKKEAEDKKSKYQLMEHKIVKIEIKEIKEKSVKC
jgi:hypothetical protein